MACEAATLTRWAAALKGAFLAADAFKTDAPTVRDHDRRAIAVGAPARRKARHIEKSGTSNTLSSAKGKR